MKKFIAVSLKYLSNFWRTLGMSQISCEHILVLTWLPVNVTSAATAALTFAITDMKSYVPVKSISI